MPTEFVYLASASPRRRALLDQIGVPHRVVPADVAEARAPAEPAEDYVRRIAAAKAEAVWRATGAAPAPVLAADTVVVVGGDVFGKPRDEAEALAMLARLSGESHVVLTALALRFEGGREDRVARSEVRFRATTSAERLAYCRSEEPYDKAGAYAIQGLGAVFVLHLAGSFSAVMGLPLCETAELLGRFGLPAWLAGGSNLGRGGP
jgi:septum formation protein